MLKVTTRQLKIDGGIIAFTRNLLKTNKEILWQKQRGRQLGFLTFYQINGCSAPKAQTSTQIKKEIQAS